MDELRYTLLSDGSSDDALLSILTWLLREYHVDCAIQPTWADLRGLRNPPRTLPGRIRWSLNLYPCDLLFVHRDAEGLPRERRVTEIEAALKKVLQSTSALPAICVVAVRMQEAWFLFDELALRQAAGNPSGKQPLTMPSIGKIEQLRDPKKMLYELLREASGLKGRRLRQMRVARLVRRVAEFAEDFAPLRDLTAFRALEKDVEQTVELHGWSSKSTAAQP